MKQCPRCKKDFDDSWEVCLTCATTRLVDTEKPPAGELAFSFVLQATPEEAFAERTVFTYRWRIDYREYTGTYRCADEKNLRAHIQRHGGELIEILSAVPSREERII